MAVSDFDAFMTTRPSWVKPHNFARKTDDAAAAAGSSRAADNGAEAAAKASEDGSFWDFLDIINPLQHIPILGSIYRAVTGDQIATPARLIGDCLYGGLIGGVLGAATATSGVVAAELLGEDPVDRAVAALIDGDATTAVADAGPTAGQTADGSDAPGADVDTSAGTSAASMTLAAAPAGGWLSFSDLARAPAGDDGTGDDDGAARNGFRETAVPDAMAQAIDRYRAGARVGLAPRPSVDHGA